jgi:hypothetical protein
MVLRTKQPHGKADCGGKNQGQNEQPRRLQRIRLTQTPSMQSGTHRKGAQPDG